MFITLRIFSLKFFSRLPIFHKKIITGMRANVQHKILNVSAVLIFRL